MHVYAGARDAKSAAGVRVCVYLCVCISMCVYIYVCICMCVYVCTCTCQRMCIQAREKQEMIVSLLRPYTCSYMCPYTCPYACPYIQAREKQEMQEDPEKVKEFIDMYARYFSSFFFSVCKVFFFFFSSGLSLTSFSACMQGVCVSLLSAIRV